MIKFLKRYLRLQGDEFDNELIDEFDKKASTLAFEALSAIANTNIKFNSLFEVIAGNKTYSPLDKEEKISIPPVYLGLNDSYNISCLVENIIYQWLSTQDVENEITSASTQEFCSSIQKYILALNYFSKYEPYHTQRLSWLTIFNKLSFTQIDYSLCHCVDYVIDIVDENDIYDALYALKKIFLSRNFINSHALLMIRKRLLKSRYKDFFREYVKEDPQGNDIMSVFSTDVNILLPFFNANNIPLIDDRIKFAEIENNGPIIDYTLYFLYVRNIMYIFSILLKDIPLE